VSDVFPVVGPSFGGSLLHIFGKGFQSSTMLSCVFSQLNKKSSS